jgi:hypothetical protein
LASLPERIGPAKDLGMYMSRPLASFSLLLFPLPPLFNGLMLIAVPPSGAPVQTTLINSSSSANSHSHTKRSLQATFSAAGKEASAWLPGLKSPPPRARLPTRSDSGLDVSCAPPRKSIAGNLLSVMPRPKCCHRIAGIGIYHQDALWQSSPCPHPA